MFKPGLPHATNAVSKKVVKPRSKVTRACDSCRKKKIKCSGTVPCKSCQTYDCECIYSRPIGSAPSQGKVKIPSLSFTAANSQLGDSVPILNDASGEADETGESRGRGAAETIRCSCGHSVADRECTQGCCDRFFCKRLTEQVVSGQDASSDNIGVSNNGAGRISRSATSPSASETVLYVERKELTNRIKDLKACIARLQQNSNPQSESIVYAIKNIEFEIASLKEKNSRPLLDYRLINESEFGQDTSICLESKLLRNHYSRNVRLNRYTQVDTKNIHNYLNKPPLIDIRFGLFCPALCLSLRGIGHLFKEFMNKKFTSDRVMKETLYLLLRHFDVGSVVESKNGEMWASPLYYYCKSRCSTLSDDERLTYMLNQIPSDLLERAAAARHDLTLGQWQKLKTLSAELIVKYYSEMFHWAVAMLEINRFDFQRKSQLSKTSPDNSAFKASAILEFIQRGELLSSLCLYFYPKIVITRPDNERLSYVEDILDLIGNEFWVDDFQTFSTLLPKVCHLVKSFGLNRWETYLVTDERGADVRRTLYWKAYIWDKYATLLSGTQPMLEADNQSPLLPQFMTKMNFIDFKDLVNNFDQAFNVDTVDFSAELNSKLLSVVLPFGFFTVALFFGEYQTKVLSNHRYSDFRVYALSNEERLTLAEELFNELRKYESRTQVLRNGMKKIFDNAKGPYDPESGISLHDYSVIGWLVLTMETFFTNCVVSSTHLLSRLNLDFEPDSIKLPIIQLRKNISDTWKQVVSLLELNNDIYNIWHIARLMFIVAISYIGENLLYFKQIAFVDLLPFLKICPLLDHCGLSCDSLDNENTRIHRTFLQTQFFSKIIARTVIHFYIEWNDKSTEDLLLEVEQSSQPELKQTVIDLLDLKSEYFSRILHPIQESELHLQIKNWLHETLPDHSNFIFSSFTLNGNPFKTTRRQEDEESDIQINQANNQLGIPALNSTRDNGNVDESSVAKGDIISSKLPDGSSVDVNLKNGNMNSMFEDPNSTNFNTAIGEISGSKPTESQNLIDQGFVYNLGTIDQFVDHGDLDQLYNAIWDDFIGIPPWNPKSS